MVQTQMQMCQHAAGRTGRIFRAFEEIQQSGNPLTKDEVARLIAKHPNRYAALKGQGG